MNKDSLKRRLAREEGERLVAYLDIKGILTVGIGHNCVARPVEGVNQPGDRITEEQEQELFDADVNEAITELNGALPWWTDLDDDRQNVMIDLCFNMGIHTLLQFHDTLAAIEGGDYEAAAEGMRHSKWHAQVGSRAVFLEAAMRSGTYA